MGPIIGGTRRGQRRVSPTLTTPRDGGGLKIDGNKRKTKGRYPREILQREKGNSRGRDEMNTYMCECYSVGVR